MNCVLLGYGTVGKNIEALCRNHPDLNLQTVFVRPSRADEPYFSADGQAMVTRDDTDIVFECLNGLEPANTLIRAALKAGKHVISSNKAVLSAYLPDYLQLAGRYGGSLQIEASAGGGIPLIDGILKLSRAEDLEGFEGILNGTSNYILSSMESGGASFEDALKKAQELGYAEADPTADIGGQDVWYKTLLIASLITRTPLNFLPEPTGIARISSDDIALAAKHGRKIRHLAMIRHENGQFAALIAPVFLKNDHYLAGVGQNYNAQLIYAPSFGSLGYYGPGAGGSPTAQAMLADAMDILEGRIRTADLDRRAVMNQALIVKDWIVRSDQDLSSLPGADGSFFEEKDVWLFRNETPDLTETILSVDPAAMIGVWNQE